MMTESSAEYDCGIETVAIVGVGLIGGSIAAALGSRELCGRVIGVGRDPAKLQPAVELGLLDEVAPDLATAAAAADLLVFCTPVDRIVEGVREAAGHCRAGTLITDAGSVKGRICEALGAGLPESVTFVGSHPLAGSEKNGFEHAAPDLFDGRVCVVTPADDCPDDARRRVTGFWESLGMAVVETTPAEHDRLLALASHVPHVVAPSLASILDAEVAPLTASGFRDCTRIAASDPALWTAIFEANRDSLEAGLQQFAESFERFREAIRNGDWAGLQNLLQTAKRKRDAL